MNQWTFHSRTLADTDRLGAALAALTPDRTTLALRGTLGAGKTRLVQAFAAACGVDRHDVTSPTFVLCQEYHGRRMVFHFDAYRLRSDEEFWRLGPEEYFSAPGVTLIEWADRVAGCLPDERIDVDIQVTDEASREFTITVHGERFRGWLERLRDVLADAPP